MNLQLVALTGADNNTSIDELANLSKIHPYVEWGILVSTSRNGETRYPDFDWIEDFIKVATRERLNTALHVCGVYVVDLLKGKLHKEIEKYFETFDRIQINLDNHIRDVTIDSRFLDLRKAFQQKRFLIGADYRGCQSVPESFVEYDLFPLMDSSAGRGILSDWYVLEGADAQGFTGGLGPENIETQIQKIKKLVQEQVPDLQLWLDMETKIRTNYGDESLFDIEKCKFVLESCLPYVGDRRCNET